MKRNCLVILFLSMCWMPAGFAQQTPATVPQAAAPTEFPKELLNGSENFNLAIDVFGDARGNFGPCG